MKVVIGIPARFSSTRFPGKPLALLAGKPMIAHVVARAQEADVGDVFVATDDERIADAVRDCGVQVCMTRADHASGTDRLAEAVADMDCDVVINVQGDEPLIDPAAIKAVLEPFDGEPALAMATLAHPIRDEFDLNDPNVVKVVCDAAGHALYFSRSPIPFLRDEAAATPLQHVGLYAYRRDFIMKYSTLLPSPLEQAEHLEQLRVLHHGYAIGVRIGDFHCLGIDTPEDLQRAGEYLRSGRLRINES
ncbi:MAG: 3-deoxy-manno-octulosonate cytidylyltransferase [Mariprofundaceae bacterium]|nr:3-deoxy-manno-octulosonate cytidylyltransferase [Mariprofundaceae bacterium]